MLKHHHQNEWMNEYLTTPQHKNSFVIGNLQKALNGNYVHMLKFHKVVNTELMAVPKNFLIISYELKFIIKFALF